MLYPCSCTPSSTVATHCHSLYPVITRCHLLSLVITCYRPSSHVTTRYHPFSSVVTRYHPLSPVVIRGHLSSPVRTRIALKASHWYQTRYILLHPGEMLSWGSWFGGSRGDCILRWLVDDVELASQAALSTVFRAIGHQAQCSQMQWDQGKIHGAWHKCIPIEFSQI